MNDRIHNEKGEIEVLGLGKWSAESSSCSDRVCMCQSWYRYSRKVEMKRVESKYINGGRNEGRINKKEWRSGPLYLCGWTSVWECSWCDHVCTTYRSEVSVFFLACTTNSDTFRHVKWYIHEPQSLQRVQKVIIETLGKKKWNQALYHEQHKLLNV